MTETALLNLAAWTLQASALTLAAAHQTQPHEFVQKREVAPSHVSHGQLASTTAAWREGSTTWSRMLRQAAARWPPSTPRWARGSANASTGNP